MQYTPCVNIVGGFSPNDGTIDFYLRVNSLLQSSNTVLDLGAGRAAWFDDDRCETRRKIRTIKGKVAKIIAADTDEAVLSNKSSDQQILIKDGRLDIDRESVDLVVADYVLEHIEDPTHFVDQVDYVLKRGGWFCGRTPHRLSYVAIMSSLIHNAKHAKILRKVQPHRKAVDIFPTAYKMNTMSSIRKRFPGWEDRSFIYRVEPAYFFGNKQIHALQSTAHRILPSEFSGNIFVFMRKQSL